MVLRKVGVGCDDADDDVRDESSQVNSKARFGKQAKTLVPTQSASRLSTVLPKTLLLAVFDE
jgi:hypothetical protein